MFSTAQGDFPEWTKRQSEKLDKYKVTMDIKKK